VWKRQKQKRHSCKLCKPHKMGWSGRWKPREREALERSGREIRHAKRRAT
jgi:hypothetical protein